MPSSADEGSQQSSDGLDTLRDARDMISSIKTRKIDIRKAVELEHKQRLQKSVFRIQSASRFRRASVLQMYSGTWSRLDSLQKKKKDIEKQIISKMKDMEHHSSNFAIICATLYEDRIAAIAEFETTGKVNVRQNVDNDKEGLVNEI